MAGPGVAGHVEARERLAALSIEGRLVVPGQPGKLDVIADCHRGFLLRYRIPRPPLRLRLVPVMLRVLSFRPRNPRRDVDQVSQLVGFPRPPFVRGVIHRRGGCGVHHHLHELRERQPPADVVPRVTGARQVAPNGTPMLTQDPDEGNYSPSSIPANSAHWRHIAE